MTDQTAHVTRLVGIKGWGVRCSCGWQLLSSPGWRLLKAEAKALADLHKKENA